MRTSNTTVQRFYRWNAPIYDLTRWALLRGRRTAVEALRLRSGQRVLELGCGTGLNFARLRERVGATGCVVGVDLSWHMLARARRRLLPRTYLLQADAARLPLDGTFNAVLLSYSLTMIPQWERALDQACGLLAPTGTLVVLDFAPAIPGQRLWQVWLNRYLAWNHVDAHRDLRGALARRVAQVEELPGVAAYVTLLRGSGGRIADGGLQSAD
jgi:S-adenosylmethionine-diacylgycerolhomoserine-N-methlytransferase